MFSMPDACGGLSGPALRPILMYRTFLVSTFLVRTFLVAPGQHSREECHQIISIHNLLSKARKSKKSNNRTFIERVYWRRIQQSRVRKESVLRWLKLWYHRLESTSSSFPSVVFSWMKCKKIEWDHKMEVLDGKLPGLSKKLDCSILLQIYDFSSSNKVFFPV